MADITVDNQGTVVLFTINTEAARTFVNDNLGLENWQWLGTSSFAVDHRYAGDIIQGMVDDGLVVD